MIENEDMATTPRPIAHETLTASPSTIQVPAHTRQQQFLLQTHLSSVDDLLALKSRQ